MARLVTFGKARVARSIPSAGTKGGGIKRRMVDHVVNIVAVEITMQVGVLYLPIRPEVEIAEGGPRCTRLMGWVVVR